MDSVHTSGGQQYLFSHRQTLMSDAGFLAIKKKLYFYSSNQSHILLSSRISEAQFPMDGESLISSANKKDREVSVNEKM